MANAQKQCKEEKRVEEREVSRAGAGDFHKLINTNVEISKREKVDLQFGTSVASACRRNFDRREIGMIEYKPGCAR
jgi:hypothetical protein